MTTGEKLITLLGFYTSHESGSEKALFHERMERAVEEMGIPPIDFKHPMEDEIFAQFDLTEDRWSNIIVSGEAGVGKTRIIHKLVKEVLGKAERLKGKGCYWEQGGTTPVGTKYTAYVNRDLSASRKFGAGKNTVEERDRLVLWSNLILNKNPAEHAHFFIIAANDGQLLKAWKDFSDTPVVMDAYQILEGYVQSGELPSHNLPLRIFHLSSLRADTILDLCIDAFLGHPGWESLLLEHSGENDIFSELSPLRRNYEGLKDPLVRRRLHDIALLCHSNDWHLPVRNILALLANTILGCSDRQYAPTGVMDILGVRRIMADKKTHAANFFANIFGLNLDPEWREKFLGPIESFRVGLETSNHADSMILYGPDDKDFLSEHSKIFLKDPTFPPDPVFERFRIEYTTTGPMPQNGFASAFYDQLIAQRRRLFFRVPEDMEENYNPWSSTNFHFAKEYLEQLLVPSIGRRALSQKLLGPLIIGLNRIWTGLLLDDPDHLFITTSLDYASAGYADIEVKQVPTRNLSDGEPPYVNLEYGLSESLVPRICVYLRNETSPISINLTLTRFEFLKRVANGSLPSSFSKECSEDIRAFKSRLLASIPMPLSSSIRMLRVTPDGKADSFTLNLSQQ